MSKILIFLKGINDKINAYLEGFVTALDIISKQLTR